MLTIHLHLDFLPICQGKFKKYYVACNLFGVIFFADVEYMTMASDIFVDIDCNNGELYFVNIKYNFGESYVILLLI